LGQGTVAGSCENSIEPSGSMKCGEYLGYYYLSKKGFAPQS